MDIWHMFVKKGEKYVKQNQKWFEPIVAARTSKIKNSIGKNSSNILSVSGKGLFCTGIGILVLHGSCIL